MTPKPDHPMNQPGLDIEKLQKLCEYARQFLEAPCIISGGAVRDSLHGREVKDIDIFVQVKPEEISKTAEFEGVICSPVEPLFVKRCRALADFFASMEGGDGVTVDYKSHPENQSGGDIADLVNIVGTPYPVQVIAVLCDPVDDVQNYDFALSQTFVTPRGLFYTERYLGDANGLTVTYTGDAEVGSARFSRSVKRYLRLKAKYEPEFTFLNCAILDKAIADSIL
jgi:hypothetical protein